MFQAYGGWHSPFTPQLVQPGAISMVNASGPARRTLGRSSPGVLVDNSTIWTMSGNWASGDSPHCEAFAQQNFVTSGGATGSTVESNLDSVGDLSVLY